jgi:hypothetical protein
MSCIWWILWELIFSDRFEESLNFLEIKRYKISELTVKRILYLKIFYEKTKLRFSFFLIILFFIDKYINMYISFAVIIYLLVFIINKLLQKIEIRRENNLFHMIVGRIVSK